MVGAAPVAVSGVVHVDYRKYPDVPHWRYDMYRLADDEHGVWLWAPAGTLCARGGDPPEPAPSVFIKLVTPGAWQTAIWNADGEYELYVDIGTPPRWVENTVQMIDLDLDIVVRRGRGEPELLDEDEFAAHRVEFAYPPRLVAGARAAAAAAMTAIGADREPYVTAGPERLRDAIARSTRV